MLVESNFTPLRLAQRSWFVIAILTLIAYAASWSYELSMQDPSGISQLAVGFLIAAVSIFLSFRFSESYERWWEARKLWGALVNCSRGWGQLVVSGIRPGLPGAETEEGATGLQRSLVFRQIAFVNALRISLREGPRYEDAPDEYDELARFVAPTELEELSARPNIPTALLERQAREIGAWATASADTALYWQELASLLRANADIQGGCERIKNTTFPAQVSAATRYMVWALSPLIMFSIIEQSQIDDLIELSLVVFVAAVFVVIEQLGRDLKDPFENQPSDTPMTALCRTIERDLLGMLEESELPPPIRPSAGVLM